MATTASTRPVGEGQAVAPPGQLAGQEGVLGHEAGQEGEAVEAGVAAGVEDEQGGQLDHVEEELAEARWSRRRRGPPGRPRSGTAGVGDGMGQVGQEGDPEHQEGQHRAHDHQGDAGVARLGAPEAGHPVGDGLQPGERGPAVGEGAQQRDEGQAHQQAAPRRADVPADQLGRRGERAGRWRSPRRRLHVADHDDRAETEDEEVGGHGEEPAGLADAPQVAVEEEQDHRRR